MPSWSERRKGGRYGPATPHHSRSRQRRPGGPGPRRGLYSLDEVAGALLRESLLPAAGQVCRAGAEGEKESREGEVRTSPAPPNCFQRPLGEGVRRGNGAAANGARGEPRRGGRPQAPTWADHVAGVDGLPGARMQPSGGAGQVAGREKRKHAPVSDCVRSAGRDRSEQRRERGHPPPVHPFPRCPRPPAPPYSMKKTLPSLQTP